MQMSECVFFFLFMQVFLSVYKLNICHFLSVIIRFCFLALCKENMKKKVRQTDRNAFVFHYIAACNSMRIFSYCYYRFFLFFSDGAKKKASWTPEEEEELQRVFEEHKDSEGVTPFTFMLILQISQQLRILCSRYAFRPQTICHFKICKRHWWF